MKNKSTYHILNSPAYNKALIKRTSKTLWFDEKSIKRWLAKPSKSKKSRPFTYADQTILYALMIKSVYHIPLRALCRLLTSVTELLSIRLPTPRYTSICRRAQNLGKPLKKLSTKHPTDIVFDSSGVKIYREGEWKVRQHGKSKQRTSRKIHLTICPNTHEIILSALTENNITDASLLKNIAHDLPKSAKRAYADGAYDQSASYQSLHKKEPL